MIEDRVKRVKDLLDYCGRRVDIYDKRVVDFFNNFFSMHRNYKNPANHNYISLALDSARDIRSLDVEYAYYYDECLSIDIASYSFDDPEFISSLHILPADLIPCKDVPEEIWEIMESYVLKEAKKFQYSILRDYRESYRRAIKSCHEFKEKFNLD